ncbi:MAG: 2-hydroxyacyl-CoA dehydratase family protein [Lachnospiraceae bacterium]|nr:2-hydroxyacyl-CoA dehydratase family protein [Lachnospiraceae bacterium]
MKILALSGIIPEHICDVDRFFAYAGDKKINHYCGYVADYICQVEQDDRYDGAVYPKSCDSCRVISSYLRSDDKFSYQFPSISGNDENAWDFLACVLKDYKSALENFYEIEISVADVENRIEIINKRAKELEKIYENLENISYFEYMTMIHQVLSLPLEEQVGAISSFEINDISQKDNSVFIVGSTLSQLNILQQIEDLGLNIVGDSLPESGRLISKEPVTLSDDVYKSIAKSMLSGKKSPSENDFHQMLELDMEEITSKKVVGVIFLTQKYCEPYNFYKSVYKKKLDELCIKYIEIEQKDTVEDIRADVVLETFAEMIVRN